MTYRTSDEILGHIKDLVEASAEAAGKVPPAHIPTSAAAGIISAIGLLAATIAEQTEVLNQTLGVLEELVVTKEQPEPDRPQRRKWL